MRDPVPGALPDAAPDAPRDAPLRLTPEGTLHARSGVRLRGVARVPGDKSLSHRALILPALAAGVTRIRGLNRGEDVACTRRALDAFGVRFTDEDEETLRIDGTAGRLREPENVLDIGNSGTSLRLLAGLAALCDGLAIFTGDASLRRRPVARVTEPLARMGAVCDARDGGARAPLSIRGAGHAAYGGRLIAQRVDLEIASAQVKSAMLLAGTGARGLTSFREPHLSRDHTERLLAACGVEVTRRDGRLELEGPCILRPPHGGSLTVARDPSAAAFLVVAALLCPDSEVRIPGVCVNPARLGWVEVLRAMGGDITVVPATEATGPGHADVFDTPGSSGGEPVGDLVARSSALHGVDIAPELVPSLVDEVPILAIAAACARGVTTLRGAGDLRVKESDRLATMAAGLATCGVTVAERPDGLDITGGAAGRVSAARIAAHGDHRVAMSFAVLGLVAGGRRAGVTGATLAMQIDDARPIATSFPDFVAILNGLAR